MQVAFHGADGHVEQFRYFGWIEVFLVAEDHDRAGIFGQIGDQSAQATVEHGIGFGPMRGGLGYLVEMKLRPQPALAYFVDAAVANGTSQPPGRMGGCVDAAQIRVHLQKDILGEFPGGFAVAKETECDAENHRLVLGQGLFEVNRHIRYYALGQAENAK
jgi:hypothetical protein